MSIVLVGSTSGSVTLQEPAVAGTTVLDLPATSGTILTSASAISASSITTGTLPKAQLPTGSVLQVLSTTKTDAFTTTNTSWVDITALSVSITPISASNKILVFTSIQMNNATSGQGFYFRLVRNSTPIAIGDVSESRAQATNQDQAVSSGRNTTPMNAIFLDSPATTSSTTYKCQTAALDVGTIVVNRSSADSNNATYARTVSTITVMEIVA
jgi:hypothetical protein